LKNKILNKFSKRLDGQPDFANKFLSFYPSLDERIRELKVRQSRELDEFILISKNLATYDVHLLLIKSEGVFPHESSNYDCLVKNDKLLLCLKLLKDEGYTEELLTREPHKYLYRKVAAPKELPLHIHTRVEWEAAEFASSEILFQRAQPFLSEETGALVPSVEDSILITIAHYFFEDHEIKIYDLLKICALINQKNVNWEYMHHQAEKLGWGDALDLNLYLLNQMSLLLFGKDLFPQIGRLESSVENKLALRTIKAHQFGQMKVPYGVSAMFFLFKIFRTPHYSFYQKNRHIKYVLSDILRRRIIGYIDY
jgi:hypothetical protein